VKDARLKPRNSPQIFGLFNLRRFRNFIKWERAVHGNKTSIYTTNMVVVNFGESFCGLKFRHLANTVGDGRPGELLRFSLKFMYTKAQ